MKAVLAKTLLSSRIFADIAVAPSNDSRFFHGNLDMSDEEVLGERGGTCGFNCNWLGLAFGMVEWTSSSSLRVPPVLGSDPRLRYDWL